MSGKTCDCVVIRSFVAHMAAMRETFSNEAIDCASSFWPACSTLHHRLHESTHTRRIGRAKVRMRRDGRSEKGLFAFVQRHSRRKVLLSERARRHDETVLAADRLGIDFKSHLFLAESILGGSDVRPGPVRRRGAEKVALSPSPLGCIEPATECRFPTHHHPWSSEGAAGGGWGTSPAASIRTKAQDLASHRKGVWCRLLTSRHRHHIDARNTVQKTARDPFQFRVRGSATLSTSALQRRSHISPHPFEHERFTGALLHFQFSSTFKRVQLAPH